MRRSKAIWTGLRWGMQRMESRQGRQNLTRNCTPLINRAVKRTSSQVQSCYPQLRSRIIHLTVKTLTIWVGIFPTIPVSCSTPPTRHLDWYRPNRIRVVPYSMAMRRLVRCRQRTRPKPRCLTKGQQCLWAWDRVVRCRHHPNQRQQTCQHPRRVFTCMVLSRSRILNSVVPCVAHLTIRAIMTKTRHGMTRVRGSMRIRMTLVVQLTSPKIVHRW